MLNHILVETVWRLLKLEMFPEVESNEYFVIYLLVL